MMWWFCSKSNKVSKSEPNTALTIKSNLKLDDAGSKSAGVSVSKPAVLNPLPGKTTGRVVAYDVGLCKDTGYNFHKLCYSFLTVLDWTLPVCPHLTWRMECITFVCPPLPIQLLFTWEKMLWQCPYKFRQNPLLTKVLITKILEPWDYIPFFICNGTPPPLAKCLTFKPATWRTSSTKQVACIT